MSTRMIDTKEKLQTEYCGYSAYSIECVSLFHEGI